MNKTFYDISTVEDVALWSRDAFLGRIYRGFTKPSQNITNILQPYDQNGITSTALTRVTVRNLKTTVVNDSSGHQFTVRSPLSIGFTDPYTTSETINDIQTSDNVLVKSYTSPGTYETFRQQGGYVWVFTRSLDEARQSVAELQHPKVLNLNTAIIAFQTVYISRNYQIFGLCEFVLGIESTGEVTRYYKSKTFQIDLYSCDYCTAKAILELIYLFCILKQTYDLIKKWFEEWKETSKITPINPEYRNRKEWHVKFLNYDIENFKIFPFMLAVVIRVWQIARRISETTTNLFKRSYANLVVSVSLVLTYTGLYYYFSFMLNDFRRSFKLTDAFSQTVAGVTIVEEVGRYEELALLIENYTTIQAFNSWFIILRILFEFGFSRELSLVLDLMYEALFDITFFVAMFFIILFGFSIDGYLLFGTQADSFHNITESLLHVLLIMISGDTPDDMASVDKVTKAAYFALLVIICLLILMKMFLAILDGHFTEMTEDEQTNDNLGVIQLIISVVIEKVKAANIEETYEDYPRKAGKLTKLRIDGTNLLKRLRHDILMNLRKIIFGSEDDNIEEGAGQAEQKIEVKKIDLNIDFKEAPEDRKEELKDIDIYLEEEKMPISMMSPQIEKKEAENDLILPSKWMNHLEESILRISNGKVAFTKSGIGAKDYLDIELTFDSSLLLKLYDIEKKCNEDRPKSMDLLDYYVEFVAIADYRSNLLKGYKGLSFYQSIMEHLHFIFFKSLQNKKEEDAPEEDAEPRDEKTDFLLHPLHRKASMKKRFFSEKSAYREASFNDPNENLLKFWNTLKFHYQYELWAGERADFMSNDLRTCLWQQMKFEGATFGPFVQKQLFIENELNPEAIGLSELRFIWDQIKITSERKSREKQFDKGLICTHIDLIEYVVRSNMENIIFELGKLETTKDRIKFLQSLKTVKNDNKLMLWLLTPPENKMEIAFRIQDDVLADFTMLLLMEEVYDNVYLLQKLEKSMNHEMKNRVYMHFLFFANFEASQQNMLNYKQDYLPESDADLLEYVRFLENQFESTTHAKEKCLEEVHRVLKNEEQVRSLMDISKHDHSGLQMMERLALGRMNDDDKVSTVKKGSLHNIPANKEDQNLSAILKEVDDHSRILGNETENKDTSIFQDKDDFTPPRPGSRKKKGRNVN